MKNTYASTLFAGQRKVLDTIFLNNSLRPTTKSNPAAERLLKDTWGFLEDFTSGHRQSFDMKVFASCVKIPLFDGANPNVIEMGVLLHAMKVMRAWAGDDGAAIAYDLIQDLIHAGYRFNKDEVRLLTWTGGLESNELNNCMELVLAAMQGA